VCVCVCVRVRVSIRVLISVASIRVLLSGHMDRLFTASALQELYTPTEQFPHNEHIPGTYIQWNVNTTDWMKLQDKMMSLPYQFSRDEEVIRLLYLQLDWYPCSLSLLSIYYLHSALIFHTEYGPVV